MLERPEIVLLAASGQSNYKITQEPGLDASKAGRWRNRLIYCIRIKNIHVILSLMSCITMAFCASGPERGSGECGAQLRGNSLLE